MEFLWNSIGFLAPQGCIRFRCLWDNPRIRSDTNSARSAGSSPTESELASDRNRGLSHRNGPTNPVSQIQDPAAAYRITRDFDRIPTSWYSHSINGIPMEFH